MTKRKHEKVLNVYPLLPGRAVQIEYQIWCDPPYLKVYLFISLIIWN